MGSRETGEVEEGVSELEVTSIVTLLKLKWDERKRMKT